MVAPIAARSRPWSDFFARGWPPLATILPVSVAGVAFVVFFASPAVSLAHDWLNDDDSGYGLLLFPIALWLAWRAGIRADSRTNVRGGTIILVAAVLVRVLGSIAAELFTQRFSIWLATVGLIVFAWDWQQVRRWWLPVILLLLAVPLPALLINAFAIPLQFRASALGTALIKWRHIPVRTTGNVIQIPNATLFVAEACSGLRSLSTLVALSVLLGGMYLRTVVARSVLVLLVLPTAILLNGARIFLTAFLVYFVDPALAESAAHERQGLMMFAVALAVLGLLTAVTHLVEQRVAPGDPVHA
jgi:exosortase